MYPSSQYILAFFSGVHLSYTVGRLFSRAINFANGARKGVRGNYFHETTLAELFTTHVNLHMMEFPLIFGETNFVEVPKIRKIYGPRKKSALRYKTMSYNQQ